MDQSALPDVPSHKRAGSSHGIEEGPVPISARGQLSSHVAASGSTMEFVQNEVQGQITQLRQLVAKPRQVRCSIALLALVGTCLAGSQLAFQVLNLAMVVFSALIIWKTAMVLTISESPVVVVLRWVGLQRAASLGGPSQHRFVFAHSGSMEPAFQRGDVLFLDNHPTRINVGEIVVYSISDRDVPIVHRVLETHEQ